MNTEITCNKCGFVNPGGKIYCLKCMRYFSAPVDIASQPAPADTTPQSAPVDFWKVGTICLICVIPFCFVYYLVLPSSSRVDPEVRARIIFAGEFESRGMNIKIAFFSTDGKENKTMVVEGRNPEKNVMALYGGGAMRQFAVNKELLAGLQKFGFDGVVFREFDGSEVKFTTSRLAEYQQTFYRIRE